MQVQELGLVLELVHEEELKLKYWLLRFCKEQMVLEQERTFQETHQFLQ